MNLMTSFNILGLSPETDAAQAKRAYKAQVRRWHPDQFPEGSTTKAGAEEQLKQINIAYARVKEHLATQRPAPGVKAPHTAPQPQPNAAGDRETPDKKAQKKSWVEHLFDTLNAFAGGRPGNPSSPSSAKTNPNPRKSFEQVLDEMAAGSIPPRKNRRSGQPETASRRTTAGYRRSRPSGTTVGTVGGTQSPGPVKPVHRVRGIGKNR